MRKLLLVLFIATTALAGAARAQFCPGAAPFVFTDVPASDSFCSYITWMAATGVTTGCLVIDANNRLYCPDDFVTRKQMSAFMFRLDRAIMPSTCSVGQTIKWSGLDWGCANDDLGGGTGTVTSVLAGTGLQASPNPIVGAGSVNLAPSYQLPQSCANGQVAVSSGPGGTWACGTEIAGTGTVTSVATGAGLTGGPITAAGTIALAASQLLPTTACTVGQVTKWNGTAWACAADDTTAAGSAFLQNGNAFGATAVLGTTDTQPLDIRVFNSRVMRYEPNAVSPNVIGGSSANSATAEVRGATIAGGGAPVGGDPNFTDEAPNRVTDAYGTVGGGYANRAGDDAGTAIDRVFATVGGGTGNTASGAYSTVDGGSRNTASGGGSKVGGGQINSATGASSIVGGGALNGATANYSTVGGGQANFAGGEYSTLGGGRYNDARGESSTVGGGAFNEAIGAGSTVGGGNANTANGLYSTVGGGLANSASGAYSWAGGRRAFTQTSDATPVIHQGAFVWGDSSDFEFNTGAPNEFAVRATGGVRFVTRIDGAGAPTRTVNIDSNGDLSFGAATRQMLNLYGTTSAIGVQDSTQYFRTSSYFGWYLGGSHSSNALDPGLGGSVLMALYPAGAPPGVLPSVTGEARAQLFVSTSDRGAKEAFGDVDGQQVLSALSRMPLQTWKFRNEGHEVRHIGPTAQDFRAAFGMGSDNTAIATVDADGVALAAIQGLNAKLEAKVAAKDAEISALKREMADLRLAVEVLMARTSTDARVAQTH